MGILLSIELPKGQSIKLDKMAKKTKRPHSYIVQKALESYIDEYHDLRVALGRLRNNRAPVISRDEMKKSFSGRRRGAAWTELAKNAGN
jgi:RHH-type rel operon transcriptional repressor/antitoxin RelB